MSPVQHNITIAATAERERGGERGRGAREEGRERERGRGER